MSTQAKRAGTGSAAGGGTMQASGQVARLKAGDAQAQGVRLLLQPLRRSGDGLLEVGEESDEAAERVRALRPPPALDRRECALGLCDERGQVVAQSRRRGARPAVWRKAAGAAQAQGQSPCEMKCRFVKCRFILYKKFRGQPCLGWFRCFLQVTGFILPSNFLGSPRK